MSRFWLDLEECKKLEISPHLAFYLASLYYNDPINTHSFKEAVSRGLIDFSGYEEINKPKDVTLTQRGVDFIETIFLNSEFKNPKSNTDKYEELAVKLRELFPKGKKPGTSLMWRGSVFEVTKKLKALEKKTGAKYTEEQAIDATKRYIDSFNGVYNYMQVLPYFILKQVPINGIYEERSQLLSYIENEGQSEHNSEWTGELI